MSGRAVVIGAGPNGLTCATRLAREGWQVTVLEARDRPGGVAALEPFGDGFAAPGVLHETAGLRPHVEAALDLARHGLRRGSPRAISVPGGDGAPWSRLAGRTLEGAQPGDRDRYQALWGLIDRVGPALARVLDAPPPDPLGPMWPLLRTGFSLRSLRASIPELARIGPMCVADWMRDELVDERLRAALAAQALVGTWSGPWSPGTAINLLLRWVLARDRGAIVGGPAAVTAALVRAAAEAGVEVRLGAEVERIELEGQRAVAVQAGERLAADVVVSTCDPRQTFLDLIGPTRLPVDLFDDARVIRARGTTAKVHLGLAAPICDPGGRPVEVLHVGESLDALERAFDPVKYRQFAERPMLEVSQPSLGDPSLAPAGQHVASILVHHAPFDLEGGWTEAARSALREAVIARLSALVPDLRDLIVADAVLTPADLAREHRLSGGHPHHAEHALDQILFMRPTLDCAGYRTPIAGLYLAGSGSHPGGGVTCGPGWLGAGAVLADSPG